MPCNLQRAANYDNSVKYDRLALYCLFIRRFRASILFLINAIALMNQMIMRQNAKDSVLACKLRYKFKEREIQSVFKDRIMIHYVGKFKDGFKDHLLKNVG